MRTGEDRAGEPDGSPARTTRGVDVAVVVALTVVAALVRARARPPDGLWFDDAWVAAGAKGPVAELFAVSTSHPGFTLGLMGFGRLVSERTDLIVAPGLIAAVVTPALTYVCLRRLRVPPAISALPATAVALCWAHAVYSGRVKPYVIEVALITLVAAAVDVADRRDWRWRTGAAWAVGMVLVASIGSFAAVAAAAATLVLVVGAGPDRRVRVVTAGVQAAAQVALALTTRATYDATRVAEDWETTYDGYIDLSGGPVEVVRDLVRHLARLGQAWVEGGRAVGLVVTVVALGGLVLGATRRPHRGPARFLLLLVAIALVGSLVEQIPFGPSVERGPFPGSRASLWLIPSLAIGTGLALDALRSRAARVDGRVAASVGVAAALGAVALVALRVDDRPEHLSLGNRTATRAIERHRDASTVVLVFPSTAYAVASEPPVEVEVVPDRSHPNGFTAIPLSGRAVLPAGQADRRSVERLVGGADQVVIHSTFAAFGVNAQWDQVAAHLEALGFTRTESSTEGFNSWDRWERDP